MVWHVQMVFRFQMVDLWVIIGVVNDRFFNKTAGKAESSLAFLHPTGSRLRWVVVGSANHSQYPHFVGIELIQFVVHVSFESDLSVFIWQTQFFWEFLFVLLWRVEISNKTISTFIPLSIGDSLSLCRVLDSGSKRARSFTLEIDGLWLQRVNDNLTLLLNAKNVLDKSNKLGLQRKCLNYLILHLLGPQVLAFVVIMDLLSLLGSHLGLLRLLCLVMELLLGLSMLRVVELLHQKLLMVLKVWWELLRVLVSIISVSSSGSNCSGSGGTLIIWLACSGGVG